jgi:hypothetical protein
MGILNWVIERNQHAGANDWGKCIDIGKGKNKRRKRQLARFPSHHALNRTHYRAASGSYLGQTRPM